MADKTKKELTWKTIAEGAATIDGSLVTWRVVQATEPQEKGEPIDKGQWVEVGTRKSRVFMPRANFFRAFDGVHEIFFGREDSPGRAEKDSGA